MAVLVRRVEMARVRRQAEEARLPAPRRLPAHRRDRAVVRVHRADHDAVVPAVRGVEELSRRQNHDLGRRAVGDERVRQRRDALERLQPAARRVPVIGVHGRFLLVDHVNVRARGVKCDVARNDAVTRLHRRRIARNQLAAPGVEPEHVDPVEPLVRHHDELAGRVERGLVGMRAMPLLLAQRPRLAFGHDQVGIRRERAIVIPRKQRHARPGGQQHPAIARVHLHRRGIVPFRLLLVQEFELAAPRIPRIRADLVAVSVRRVQVPLRAVEADIGRVRNDVARLDECPRA